MPESRRPGVLSAAVLEFQAAFSINLTPSHNPLEYGGYKFNAADAGPAASEITERITANARELIDGKFSLMQQFHVTTVKDIETLGNVKLFHSLDYLEKSCQKESPSAWAGS